MKIAFLSSLDPNNINHWSGTLYFIFQSLRQNHEVQWMGGDIIGKVREEHRKRKAFTPFVPELYSPLFAEMISATLDEYDRFDVIIARDCSFIAYLKVNIPIVYIGDTTFDLIKESWGITQDNTIRLLDDIERKALLNADCIIFSSLWAKRNAISHYGIDSSKIKVVEFGANLIKVPEKETILIPEKMGCNLLFIGKDWKRKGGTKTVEIFKLLKKRNFSCTLTIIGCNPDLDNLDPDVKIVPFIDKSKEKDAQLLHQIMLKAHFFLFPTNFDCFGIVFCEVSAYGIPSITANVAGVGQVVRDGKNGYLLSSDASAGEYADLIETLFEDKKRYDNLRKSSREEFDKRLNWDVWKEKVNVILKRFESFDEYQNRFRNPYNFYIPVYVVNLKNRLNRRYHIEQEFKDRKEFFVNIIEAIKHPIGTIGLWNSLVKVIKTAMNRKEDIVIFCEDDHCFTGGYLKESLFRNMIEAERKEAELLLGGVSNFGIAVPVTSSLYWVDWYWGNQFMIIFQPLFQRILDYSFQEKDMADLVLSSLTMKKMLIYPFISIQKEFGYSDINKLNETPGYVDNLFIKASRRLSIIHKVNQYYNYRNEI